MPLKTMFNLKKHANTNFLHKKTNELYNIRFRSDLGKVEK